jgi:hypothetical protein
MKPWVSAEYEVLHEVEAICVLLMGSDLGIDRARIETVETTVVSGDADI